MRVITTALLVSGLLIKTMTKINITYEDRQHFHPEPSAEQDRVIKAILEKFGWELDIPPRKSLFGGADTYRLTRDEAKQLISKGIRKCKRDKVRIFDSEIDAINKEISYGK